VSQRILRAQVDIAATGTNRQARDHHAFDQTERVAFHQDAIGKGTAVSFVCVAGNVLLVAVSVRDGLPFNSCWETGTATTSETGRFHRFDYSLGAHLNGLFEGFEALMRAEVFDG